MTARVNCGLSGSGRQPPEALAFAGSAAALAVPVTPSTAALAPAKPVVRRKPRRLVVPGVDGDMGASYGAGMLRPLHEPVFPERPTQLSRARPVVAATCSAAGSANCRPR